MADQDQDQKTEQPTGKRLDEAREHGQIPVSKETSTWVMMLGMLVIVGWILPPMTHQMANYLRIFIEQPESFLLDDKSVQALFYQIFGHVGLIAGLVFLLMMAAIILGVMAQTGFFLATDLLAPDLMRLLPTQGFKKLFSISALFELLKSFGKLVFLGSMAFAVFMPVAIEALHLTGLPLENILAFLDQKAVHLIIMLLLVFTVIALGDLFFTRYQYIKNLRMTKEEVKDEFKQQEGDPKIKGRLRQLRMEKARKRMMAQVPKADVVITNPTHYAIALQYNAGKMSAPVVVAKGINLIADRIRELAQEHRIPLVSNPPLARALHDTVELDHAIPTQHYRAVAEVISYVYKLKRRKF
jgi:flagellar biosynthetic protein FlhB